MANQILSNSPKNNQPIPLVHFPGPLPAAASLTGDERQWCKYGQAGDKAGAANCPALRTEVDYRTWCGLNGRQRRSPCVFDEPAGAAVWQRIRRYVARCKARGWL